MGIGRRLLATTVRFLILMAIVAGLVAPQAMTFMSAERRTTVGSKGSTFTASRAFTIKGKVGGLYPGVRKSLKLRVRNRKPYTIRVKLLTVAVKKPDKAGCKKKWLRIKGTVPRFKLLARARTRVTLPVKLSKRARDACQGARWPLVYVGSGVRK